MLWGYADGGGMITEGKSNDAQKRILAKWYL